MVRRGCTNLKDIHPSIGYHEQLIFLDMKRCQRVKIFPPIFRMIKLENLILSSCSGLRKFPEIQMNMDSMVELRLRKSGIEILPSSIGQYCTNLVSLDMKDCIYLQSIESNFHLLKRLKVIHLMGSEQLKIPAEGLLDAECCLEVLSLHHMSRSPSSGRTISFKNPSNYIGLE